MKRRGAGRRERPRPTQGKLQRQIRHALERLEGAATAADQGVAGGERYASQAASGGSDRHRLPRETAKAIATVARALRVTGDARPGVGSVLASRGPRPVGRWILRRKNPAFGIGSRLARAVSSVPHPPATPGAPAEAPPLESEATPPTIAARPRTKRSKSSDAAVVKASQESKGCAQQALAGTAAATAAAASSGTADVAARPVAERPQMPNAVGASAPPAPERRRVPPGRKLHPDIAAAVERWVANGRIERIANGSWPDAGRPEVRKWRRASERQPQKQAET